MYQESHFTPLTVEKPGRGNGAAVRISTYYARRTACPTYSTVTTADVGFEPMTIHQSMANSMSQSRRQSGVIQTHNTSTTHTVDDHVHAHTLFDDVNEERASGHHSQCSSPASDVDAVDNANTHSLLEQSEVQFNPAALARARQAGWDSQTRTASTGVH